MAKDVQNTVWAFMATQTEALSLDEVADGTGLSRSQCRSTLSNLKNKHGVLLTEGGGHSTRWRVVEGAAPQLRGSGVPRTVTSDLPHVLAFKQAMDQLMDAFINLQQFIISADDKEALNKLKIAMAAMYKGRNPQ